MKPAPRLALTAFSFVVGMTAPGRAEDPWRWGPGARVRRPGFDLRLTGYVQGDFRYFGDSFENERGERPLLAGENELRRARVGFTAEWGRLEVQLQADPADEIDTLKDAYGELKIAKALHLRAGNYKVPVSAEHLISAARIDFIERAMLAGELAPTRDWGVSLLGEPAGFFTYHVGVFKGDGRRDQHRAETTVAGRLTLAPAAGVDFGLSYSDGRVEAQPEEGGAADVSPRGFPGRGPSGFLFSVRRFVEGTRRRMGADLRLTPGPVGLGAEVLRTTQQRLGQGAVFDDLPDEVALGWAVSATWLVTGEDKKRTVEPERGVHRGGVGAIELGVRYEALRYDDDGPDTGFEGAGNRARNIRPVENRVLTGGVSWWPVYWVRLMGNVAVEQFEDELLAPVPGKAGRYLSVLGRVQVSVP